MKRVPQDTTLSKPNSSPLPAISNYFSLSTPFSTLTDFSARFLYSCHFVTFVGLADPSSWVTKFKLFYTCYYDGDTVWGVGSLGGIGVMAWF